MKRMTTYALLGGVVCLFLGLAASPAFANGILVGPNDRPTAEGRGQPILMRGHRVEAVVEGRVAEVTVEQVFFNTTTRQLEGTYLFPLPDGAVVSRFAMTMGGKMVEGEVVEAKEARRIYEGIVRSRRDPGLLEYVGRGLFRARVFPILPQQPLTIRLTFQQVLPEDAGTLEFRYPLSTARFHAAPVQSVVVDVKVDSDVDLKGVYSASHRVAVERDGERKARVSYESSGKRQERDFLLYLARSPDDVGFSVHSHRRIGEDGTFMAVLAPRVEVTEEDQVPKDVVYVLDTSGSMAGEKLEQAQRALVHGIRMLHAGDRFNVVAFATTYHPFREAFVEVSAEAKAAAEAWVGGLAASGGTNIEGALTQALGMRSRDRVNLVVFLTDGRPTVGERSTKAIVKRVAASNDRGARVFTFGVGHDLDVALLDRIAETTKGSRDYVQPGEDIEIVTSRFFRKVDRPVMSTVKVAFGAGVTDVYPPEVGDLFAGEQVVVFGRYAEPGERKVTLTGRVGQREVRYEYPATFRAGEGVGSLPRLWAHRKVAFLLDEIRLHGSDPELVNEVTRLATRHAIVTPYTAGLVVEDMLIKDASLADHVETDNDLPFEEAIGGRRGLSDAPFTGPRSNRGIGLGGGAAGAFHGRGGRRTSGATEDGLEWLAVHQSPNGSWDADGFGAFCEGKPNAGERPGGPASAMSDVGATGYALAAFLGAGHTNRGRHKYAKTVSKGLRWLKNVQDAEGCYGTRDAAYFLRDHGAAALAMVEAYGMTGSPIFKGSAQRALDFLAMARNPGSVWGRGVRNGDQDLETTAALVLPLKSGHLINDDAARRGRPAPLLLDERALRDVLAWVDANVDFAGTDRLATAVGMLVRIFAGDDPRTSLSIQEGARALAATAPVWDPDDATTDVLAWYYGTLALFQAGGAPWKTWNETLKTAVIDNRRRDGTHCVAKGSWDPIGARGQAGGRVYTTALLTLCLEVYYRYDKVFGTKRPAAAPAAKSVAEQAKDSEAIRDLKQDAVAGAGGEDDGLDVVRSRIQHVSDKTFHRQRDDRWVDTAWDGEAETVKVVAYSDAYFALLAEHPAVAPYLALGDHVVFVHAGTTYEVTADAD